MAFLHLFRTTSSQSMRSAESWLDKGEKVHFSFARNGFKLTIRTV